MTQRKQLAILVSLLVVAGVIWYWYFFRGKTTASTGAVSVVENFQLLSVDNPQLHKDRLESARKAEYRTNGRNIFSPSLPPPPVPARPEPSIATPVGPPPPPPPPTLPVRFFGYGTIPNGTARRAFLTDGEEVYVVAEGEVLLNRFRIIKVGNASLEFEEVSSGRRGTAALEEQGTTPSA